MRYSLTRPVGAGLEVDFDDVEPEVLDSVEEAVQGRLVGSSAPQHRRIAHHTQLHVVKGGKFSAVKPHLPGRGQASWKLRGQDHATRHDVATPDMIRQLPEGFALILRGGCPPVAARLPRAWNNPAYKQARRAGHASAPLTLTPARTAGQTLPGVPAFPDYIPDDLLVADDRRIPRDLP
jgi:hypothetical protein